ncbi:MerR family transcriptional regulator [Taibaiella koreensis]|uniref:MerR family transcriptional regulator n=1 Tax=Taibaiella koreensis TaxID=1268548 RepID=UPI000E59B01A|nr:MerR family transcriptional regulator [Taibaiella koreensis]
MLIGELSKRSGLTKDTIRFYEKQGYIKVGWRERRVNNYKEYSEAVLRRLLLFRKIKAYGFSLNEAAELIALIDAGAALCDTVAQVAHERIEAIEEKIRELTSLKALLQSGISSCPRRTDHCSLFDL